MYVGTLDNPNKHINKYMYIHQDAQYSVMYTDIYIYQQMYLSTLHNPKGLGFYFRTINMGCGLVSSKQNVSIKPKYRFIKEP